MCREKSSIVSMINIAGSDEETITLSKAVKATGNIEDWLGALEKGMQVKRCRYVSQFQLPFGQ